MVHVDGPAVVGSQQKPSTNSHDTTTPPPIPPRPRSSYTMFFEDRAFVLCSLPSLPPRIERSTTGMSHNMYRPNTQVQFKYTPLSYGDSFGNVFGHGNLATLEACCRLFFWFWYHSMVVQLREHCITCHNNKYATQHPMTIWPTVTIAVKAKMAVDQPSGCNILWNEPTTTSKKANVVYTRNNT